MLTPQLASLDSCRFLSFFDSPGYSSSIHSMHNLGEGDRNLGKGRRSDGKAESNQLTVRYF